MQSEVPDTPIRHYFQSAPYFTLQIDGIEWLNSAYGN